LIRRNLAALPAVAVAMLAIAGCSGERIVNTSESPAQIARAPSTAAPTPSSNVHLVNAFDYVAHVGEVTGYYFTTPSGKWRCAILARMSSR